MSTEAIPRTAHLRDLRSMPAGAMPQPGEGRARPIPLSALARGRVAATTRVFGNDFDAPRPSVPDPAPEPAPEPEVIAPAFSAEELDAARALAHTEGEQAGRKAERLEIEAEAAASLGRIEQQLAQLAEDASISAERNGEAVARLVLGALRAAFPHAAAQLGQAEIEAAARALLPSLAEEKRIQIRAHPGEAETLAERIAGMIASDHLEISVEARPDPRILRGDGRIVWAGAEARRDAAALWRDIEKVFAAYGLDPVTPGLPVSTPIRSESRDGE